MKHFALAVCFLVVAVAAKAQQKPVEQAPEKEGGFKKENLFFGGNFGLSFGDYTLVNVSPQIGYRFNRYFAAGAGVNFQYSSFKYRYYSSFDNYKDTYGVAGLNIFGRAYPIDYVLVQIQPEANYTWGKRKFYNGTKDLTLDGKIIPSLIAGAGAVIPAGRGSFIIMAQYDLIQDERSPYSNRVFYNFGYNIGF